jgi:hypothetical protein
MPEKLWKRILEKPSKVTIKIECSQVQFISGTLNDFEVKMGSITIRLDKYGIYLS